MLGVKSPREPITAEFSREIRAALWRATTGNLNEKEKEARRRGREARKKVNIVWKQIFLISLLKSLQISIASNQEELEKGISLTGIPDINIDYKNTFYAKPRYPALDIAYLAVKEEYRGNKVGQSIVELIADRARTQTFASCQFLTVEALATAAYSAVGFYERCGFTANEVRKPYKDTLRMYRSLFEKDE